MDVLDVLRPAQKLVKARLVALPMASKTYELFFPTPLVLQEFCSL
jgi:hypothetical protein